MVRATLIQIDNYGPWTVTPEPRRETDLQALQARLYADLCASFGAHDAVVFFSRFDNVVAFTEGVGTDAHRSVQRSINNRYPVTVSMAVADGASPRDAVGRVSSLIQDEGSAQDADRVARLVSDIDGGSDVQVGHFDIEEATERYVDEIDAYGCQLLVGRAGLALMESMWERDAVSFFVGGDNYITVAPSLDKDDYAEVIGEVEEETDVELKVGVGESRTPADAGMQAKHCLERSRNGGGRVEFY
ncbi:GTP cyclohydrolase IIa [Haladaptatus sp. F3-133]|jgi:GTP cyclohydrolase IIa|uniref:GTP cyclohydrolase III n=1 Tax=Halorutilus salinus TaxID=2487751 RepID=A0A9Q4C6W3_9EURY|nr:GTP cyclohydrolase IIa [Halorutilus salinus]MCX2819376.1 GTP cyclohydrolase IIa [Halorutilus salinus]